MYSHTGVYMHYSTKAKRYYIVQLFTKPSADQATDFPSIMEAVVTGNNVNVRSGPGTEYKRIGKLKKSSGRFDIIRVQRMGGNCYVAESQRVCA